MRERGRARRDRVAGVPALCDELDLSAIYAHYQELRGFRQFLHRKLAQVTEEMPTVLAGGSNRRSRPFRAGTIRQ